MLDKIKKLLYNIIGCYGLIRESVHMKLIKGRRKDYLIRKSRLGQGKYNLSKRRPRPLTSKCITPTTDDPQNIENYEHSIKAPYNVSITNNYEDTVIFFYALERKIKLLTDSDELCVDLRHIEYIGTVSIIYFLGIISRVRLKNNKCKVIITLPLKKDPKERIIKSGLISFANNADSISREWHENTSEVFQIIRGNDVKNKIAGTVCKWVRGLQPGLTRLDTEPIYEMLIELMSNTYTHSGDNRGDNDWYLYSEKAPEGFNFLFFDAGKGIPKSVRKDFREKVVRLFGSLGSASDVSLLISAFKGEFRTSTGNKYRGKGLPQIAKNLNLDLIYDWTVYSGKGCCQPDKSILSEFNIMPRKMRISLIGTLYNWKINLNGGE